MSSGSWFRNLGPSWSAGQLVDQRGGGGRAANVTRDWRQVGRKADLSDRVPNFRISDSVALVQPDGVTYANASDEHNGAPFAHAVAATGSTSSFVSANYVVAPGSPRFLPGVYRLISVNAGGVGTTDFSVNQPGVQLLAVNEESAGIFDVFIRLLFDFLPGAIIFNLQKTKVPANAFANSFAIYRAIYGPKGGV